MSYACDICHKGKQFGNNVSFSQRKTKRVWKPNLQIKHLEIDGQLRKVKICTQCLRTMAKHQLLAAAETQDQSEASRNA